MDLGIRGKSALLCGSSRGLGFACASALAAEGVNVTINGLTKERLEAAGEQLRKQYPDVTVTTVQGDIDTPEGREAVLAACPNPDILVTNNAGPTPRPFAEIDLEYWMEAVTANMVAPLLMVKAVIPGMKERGFGRIINITSAMVTRPSAGMVISAGPRAGMTAALKGVSMELAKYNVTINNLLPERFDTDRQIQMAKLHMKRDGTTWEEARKRQAAQGPAQRMGRPEEFGAVCAFYCSAHTGYMTGNNIRLDGGSYPAVV